MVKVNKYVSPFTPSSGYNFVPAAVTYNKYSNLSIYIKYRSGANKIKVKQTGPTHIWFECPDRELVISVDTQGETPFVPWGHSFDEQWDLNPYNDKVAKSFDFQYLMLNYVHQGDSAKTPRCKATTKPQDRITVLSDSGGLQMSRGLTDMILPEDLMKFYNENVDAGMALDIPLPHGIPSDKVLPYLLRVAHIQSANNKRMLDMSSGPELINIIHGRSIEARKHYADIVADKRITRAAVGGLGGTGYATRSTLAGANFIYSLLEACPGYKQYHILGVFSTWMLPLLVKMANSGDNPPHLTSDSTSYVQSAIRHVYHFQFDVYHHQRRIPIGRNGSIANNYKLLPCQCPVCRAIKWMDVLGFGDTRFAAPLLSLHNAYEMARWSNSLQELCRNLSVKEYNHLVFKTLSEKSELQGLKKAFDFIDIATQAGLKVARKKWEASLNLVVPAMAAHGDGLFDEKLEETDTQAVIKKFRNVLAKFESYHGISKAA